MRYKLRFYARSREEEITRVVEAPDETTARVILKRYSSCPDDLKEICRADNEPPQFECTLIG